MAGEGAPDHPSNGGNSPHSATSEKLANVAEESSVPSVGLVETGHGAPAEDVVGTSDEDEGGPSKILPPKLKATIQRRVARVKRTLAYQ